MSSQRSLNLPPTTLSQVVRVTLDSMPVQQSPTVLHVQSSCRSITRQATRWLSGARAMHQTGAVWSVCTRKCIHNVPVTQTTPHTGQVLTPELTQRQTTQAVYKLWCSTWASVAKQWTLLPRRPASYRGLPTETLRTVNIGIKDGRYQVKLLHPLKTCSSV